MSRQTLVAAWAKWQRRPGDDVTARKMERECQAAARTLSVSTNELRIMLMEKRRSGLDLYQSVDAVVKDIREKA